MAEADMETHNNMHKRFYCHECSLEITPKLPEYTCPTCNSGFVEELEAESPGGMTTEDGHFLRHPSEEAHLTFHDGTEPNPFRHFHFPSFFEGGMGLHPRGQRITPQFTLRMSHTDNHSGQQTEGHGNAPIDMFFQQLFSNLGVTVMDRESGVSFNRIFPSSLGDYAWGPNGLDNIITQLLTQLEGTGPPPADKDKVNSLPNVNITHNDVDEGQECAVCKEAYKLEENVLKLPCKHLFHSDCVRPWLELHDSCPVCRCSLNGRSNSEYT